MAKIIIEIEDTEDGAVRFRTTPTRQEIRSMSVDDLTTAHIYAIHAISTIMKRDSETSKQLEKVSIIEPQVIQ